MLVSILGVLKSGGAYVPMDPNYPDGRISYILEDTGARVVVGNEIYKERIESLASKKVKVIGIDTKELRERLEKESAYNLDTETTSNNLAYIIYTSGTTGNPKGVMIAHREILAMLSSINNTCFCDDSFINTYSMTTYVFDIFCLEYALPLIVGGFINVGNKEFLDLDCRQYCFLQMTPSVCELKMFALKNTFNTKLFIGGERLSLSILNKLRNQFIECVHVYGPTETTVWSVSKYYSSDNISGLSYVTLGSLFENEKAYVLNKDLSPIPIGCIGELYIGGVGLARGYLNRPELTSEKFIANPFATEEDVKRGYIRLYKTGDLVRWLPDGNLEYIGREDFQVKIRGYRIELGEIESALLGYEGIKQSVVLAKERTVDITEDTGSGSKYLVGYYVSEAKLEEGSILSYLQSKLPEYMVPSILVKIDVLPLTINGKLDRSSLPNPELSNTDAYVAPRNEIEIKICQAWAEVLNLPEAQVGIRDDFFKLGGNSILAIKLINRINKKLKMTIGVSYIFKYNMISKLVEKLEEINNDILGEEYEL